MMPQKEVNEAIHQLADPEFGRYEGNQTSSAHHHDETSSEQDWREEPSGKAYPLPPNNTNILRFALVIIALALFVLFGLLFVVGVGGTTGWISFLGACFFIAVIVGFGLEKIH